LRVKTSAPGKAILFGEHSVVYRGPAVVLAIDRRVHVSAELRKDERLFVDASGLGLSGFFEAERYTPMIGGVEGEEHLKPLRVAAEGVMTRLERRTGINLSINSEFPVAVGLGSSAAAAVAAAAAVNELLGGRLSLEDISLTAFESEKVVHGTPSGIDNTIATYGGGLVYEKGRRIEQLRDLGDIPFVVGNTGKSHSTGQLVGRVGELRERNREIVDAILDTISEIARQGREALLKGDLRNVGELMNINHGLLWALGVSSPELDRLVNAALQAEALGAKLTGAGGGGCMIALTTPARLDSVSSAIESSGGSPLRVKISDSGVNVWREGG